MENNPFHACMGYTWPCPQLKLGEILKRVRLAIFEDIYEGWCFKSAFCKMSVVFADMLLIFDDFC